MTTSAIFTRQQIHSFTHFFPKECRNNVTTKLFIAALLPHLSQFQSESISLAHRVPHHLLDSVLDQFYPNHVTRILYKLREFKEELQTEIYRKCLLATQAYFRSRDFSIPGKYENKLPTSCVQYLGETARFQNLNKGLQALLKEVEPQKLSWSQTFRSCWNGFLDYCSSTVTSATSYVYNNPGKAACSLLALEAAALTVRSHMHHTTLFHEFPTQLSCTPNLMLGILTQNPIYIMAAGISCLPVASSQIVNGQIPDQLFNVDDLFSMQINMTELFGKPVTGVNISQADGAALPDWLTTGSIIGNLATTHASGVVINGNFAYVADGDAGLKIIDVSDSTNPLLRGSLSTTFAYELAVNDNFAYIADLSSGLKIIDITNNAYPFLRGELPTQYAYGVAVNDNFAYVADYNGGLKIIDVSNSTHPILMSSLPTTSAWGVTVKGTLAYVSDVGSLRIIDVSNSTNPIQVGSLLNTQAYGVVVSNNLAYVAGAGAGLQIIDISNSSNPIQIGSLPTTNAQRVTINGNFAYVADYDGGLKIIDVSNSTHPTLLSTLKTTSAVDVVVRGNLAYVADGANGLDIFALDSWKIEGIPLISKQKYHLSINAISDLSKVVRQEFYILTDNFPTSLNSIMTQSIVSGTNMTLYLSANNLFQDKDVDDTLSLRVLLQNTTLPEFVQFNMSTFMRGSLPTTSAFGIALNGNFAYLADNTGGLKIIDVSDSAHPTLKSSLPTSSALGIAFNGNFVYLADDTGGLKIIDVSDNTHPILKSSLPTTSAQKIAVNGNFVYVADYDGGLIIIDVSDSSHPILKGSFSTTNAGGVAIKGNTAYVASGGDLKIIDVSDSTHPILKGSLPTTNAVGVAVNGNFAYVADLASGLRIVDVSNSIHPILKGTLSTTATQEVAVNGNLAYVADLMGGLRIIDVSDSTNPIQIGSLPTTNTRGVAINRNLAYVSDSGLKIIDLTSYQLKATPTHNDEGNYPLTVIATDPLFATANTTFTLRVEGAPRLMQPLPFQNALIGQPFSCFVPDKTFWDPNDDIITYSVESLPSFLTFNPASATLWGIPWKSDRGQYNIPLLASDRILPPTSAIWNLLVHYAPTLSKPIPDQAADVGKLFTFTLDPHAFEDKEDHYALTYSAKKNNQTPLPQWLYFNNRTQTFFGTPQEADKGDITIAVKVDDGLQGVATGMFHLLVEHFPRLTKEFRSVFAAVGHSFSFNALSYFSDIDGEPLLFSANSEGEPLPKSVSFDTYDCRFTSTFQATDKGIIPITLIANDPNNGLIATKFNITVEDYITALTAINPPEVVIENRQPLLTAPLMEQSFSSGVTKEFSIRSAFEDPDGDPLTFNADLGDATWLSLNPSSGVFTGTPSSSDAATYATRRYTIGVTAMDPANKTTAGSFEILLQGPSLTEKILNALLMISGFAVASWGYYQKKYLLWNWCRKSKYRQPPLHLEKGKTGMVYQMGYPSNEIRSITVTSIQDGCCIKRSCYCLNTCKNAKERTFQGGAKAYLFDWLFFDPKTNQLHVTGNIPEHLKQEDIEIRIIGTDHRIMEQVNIKVREGSNEVLAQLPDASFALQLQESPHSSIVSSSALSAFSASAISSSSATSGNAKGVNPKTPLLESEENYIQ